MKTKYFGMRSLLCGVLFALTCSMGAQDRFTLQIYHTNDTHSCIEPLSAYLPDTAQANKGGYLRRATLIKQLRREQPELLLFDSGDFSQGSPYYNMFKGDVEISLMNEMGYDAGTIGNHEFDFGLENMARLFRMAKFPIVCCNYEVVGTPLEGLIKDYVILQRHGLKIGVFGLSPRMEGLVAQSNYEGLVFKDPVECANQWATFLKVDQHCDVVICLSHLGWKGEEGDEHLIPATRNIDLVLGGHSHSYFDEPVFYKNLDGEEIPLQQMGKNARFVGHIEMTFEKE